MTTIINTQHKDRLFCAIFRGKKELLSLYNAINETAYTDENALIVNTLDNAIYMTMKNDVSFLIYGVLNLYEHQSTWNPNMPLRDFLYVSQQIKKMVEEKGWDLYGSRLVKIPTPQAVVFYNGKRGQPERQILKLSDAFENQEKPGCMEFQCLVLNINYGQNRELMEKCKPLLDYAAFIDRIRHYEKQELNLENAVQQAIEECVKEDILAEYLRTYRSEVTNMILSEYDEQKHIENEKRWSYEDGREDGYADGREDGYADGREDGYADGREDGYEDGGNKVSRLYELLILDGRREEMEMALTDRELRHQFMVEYKLIET